MKLLVLGGTGTISNAVTNEALRQGMDVTILTRGRREKQPGVKQLIADVRDREAMRAALHSQTFDAAADFLTFLPEQARQNIDLFMGRVGQYLFISSATVYEKPPRTLMMREDVQRTNPFSPYAQNKIACEDVFLAGFGQNRFPVTIVRPSYTYDDTSLPFVFNSHKSRWAVIRRMREGKPIVIPGDGSIFWTITHAKDFARAFTGLIGQDRAIGESFHITSDERHTWDDFCRMTAAAAGANIDICHVATDTLLRFMPDEEAALLGDKAQTAVFDNSKIKAFVPGFKCEIPFAQGIKGCIRYFDSHPEARVPDPDWDAAVDRMVAQIRSIQS